MLLVMVFDLKLTVTVQADRSNDNVSAEGKCRDKQ